MTILRKLLLALTFILFVVPFYAPTGHSGHASPTRSLTQPSWPMIGRDAHHSGRGLPSAEGIYRPYLRWNTTFSQTSFGAVLGNFTENVHFNSTTPSPLRGLAMISGGTLYLLDGEDGKVVWKANFDGLDGVSGDDIGWTAPLILDSDSDGRAEVLVAFPNSTEDSRVILYEPSIERNPYGWNQTPARRCEMWNTTLKGEARYSSPVSGDLNGDGYVEVVLATNQALYALNATTGAILFQYNLSLPPGTLISPPTLIEFNSRVKDVLLSYISANTYHLVAVRWGTLLYRKSIPLGLPPLVGVAFPPPAPVVGDFTPSSGLEYAALVPSVNSNARIFVYSVAGNEIWNKSLKGIGLSTPAADDMNNDGKDDIILLTSGFDQSLKARMYCLSGRDGRTLWSRVKSLSATTTLLFPSSPVIADINNDGHRDAVFLVREAAVGIDGRDGSYLWNYTSPPKDLKGCPIVGEINGRVFLDIFSDGILLSNELVDLTVSPSEIYLSSDPVVEGVNVIVSAIVRNLGSSTAKNVYVKFYDTTDSGTRFMGEVKLDEVQESQQASVEWSFEGAGTHTITVQVDPDNAIKETNEENNQATRWIEVKPSFPDLVVEDAHFFRGDGTEVDGVEKHLVEDEDSWVNATVVNVGYKSARVVPIALYINGTPVYSDSFLHELPPGSSFNVTIPFEVDTSRWGYMLSFNITVDPENSVEELSETNNSLLTNMGVTGAFNPSAHYYIEGYTQSRSGPVAGAKVVIENRRSGESITLYSNSQGRYSTDLHGLPSHFREGDEVSLWASKGGLRSDEVLIRVYSEDVGKAVNLTLREVPFREIVGSVVGGNSTIGVNETVSVLLAFNNTGTLPANITIEVDHPLVDGVAREGWRADVDKRSLSLPPGGGATATLYVTSPTAEGCPPGSIISVKISAACVEDENVGTVVWANLTVRRVEGLEVKGLRTEIKYDPNIPFAPFSISLRNWGNVQLHVTYNVSGPLSAYLSEGEGSLRLEAGEAKTLSLNLSTPPSDEGEYRGFVNVVAGGFRRSLSLLLQVVKPDLSFEGGILLTPPSPTLGQSIYVEVTVVNRGSSTASDFYVSVYANSQMILRERIDYLMVGGRVSRGGTWTPSVVGVYNIRAYVDPDGKVAERDENNNDVNMTVEFSPHLILKRFDQANLRPVILGRPEVFIVTLKNSGNAPFNGVVFLKLYVETETGRRPVATYNLPISLNSSEERSFEVTWTPEGLEKGEVTVVMTLESGGGGEASLLIVVKKQVKGGEEYPSSAFYVLLVAILLTALYLLYRYSPESLRERFKGMLPETEEGVEEEKGVEEEGTVIEEVEDEEIVRSLEELVVGRETGVEGGEIVEEGGEEEGPLEAEVLEGVVLGEILGEDEEVRVDEVEE